MGDGGPQPIGPVSDTMLEMSLGPNSTQKLAQELRFTLNLFFFFFKVNVKDYISFIFDILTWYQSHFLVAFNVLVFPRVPSNNLNAQVHRHSLPKALCLFNITRVTRRSDSVCRFDNCPSGLSFLFMFWP
jgi:hypothetical protein